MEALSFVDGAFALKKNLVAPHCYFVNYCYFRNRKSKQRIMIQVQEQDFKNELALRKAKEHLDFGMKAIRGLDKKGQDRVYQLIWQKEIEEAIEYLEKKKQWVVLFDNGWNTVHAVTQAEAEKIAKEKYSSKVRSVKIPAPGQIEALMRMFY